MLIDAHCHLDFAEFDADRHEQISRATKAGVRGFIVAGVDPEGWDRQQILVGEHRNIRAAFGLHPWAVARMTDKEVGTALGALEQRLEFAVGETGLDRTRHCPPASYPLQKEAFSAQLRLARDRNLPVILHIIGAHGDALRILEEEGIPEAGGMIHSYSGSAEMVPRYEALGLYLSFSASVTRPNARKIHEALQATCEHRLLVETDCPDQMPSQRQGPRNLPEWLTDVVDEVARVRGQSVAEISRITARNACTLFSLEEWL